MITPVLRQRPSNGLLQLIRSDRVAGRDLAILLAACAVVPFVFAYFEVFEWVSSHHAWLEQYQLDEIIPAFVCYGLFFGVFAARRWRATAQHANERRLAEVRAALAAERLEDVFAATPEPTFVYDLQTRKVTATNAAFDTSRDEIFPAGEVLPECLLLLLGRLRRAVPVDRHEVTFEGPQGERTVLFSARVLGGGEADVVCSYTDITERVRLSRDLEHQALHDGLTGLPNRSLFIDRVGHALRRGHRSGEGCAVIYLDLDGFKRVNDTLGHEMGDRLLTRVASLVRSLLREGDTFARLGGDEFAILLEGNERTAGAHAIAGRIATALQRPIDLGGKEVVISASQGIAALQPGTEVDDLIRSADLAMYVAKGEGPARIREFDPALHNVVHRRMQLERDLPMALEQQQFELHFQPITALRTGEVRGVEALVRWRHPEHGTVPPSDFIGLAESSGAIVGLGRWILQTACAEIARLNRESGGAGLHLSVNVSPRQLTEPGFFDVVQEALATSGLPATNLTLEFTENVLVEDGEGALNLFRALKELGLKLAIDDFGTGYSSLAYLQRFPFDVLKIDRTFVEQLATEDGGSPITRAILSLGRTLELQTVAEGVEVNGQLDQLRDLGCELGQGYLFARPMAMHALRAFMDKRSEPVVAA